MLGISKDSGLPDASMAATQGLGVVLEGSLFNEADLAEELELAPSCDRIEPGNPAVTLLAAFRRWGEDSFGRLRGAFAAVITDGTKLWCIRDHLGASTLFFRQEANGVYVATEIKQVVAGAGISRRPDLAQIRRMFFGQVEPLEEPPCLVVGVERVPRASALEIVGDGPPRCWKHWDPSPLIETARLDHDEIHERLARRLQKAVDRCVTGNDVVALSGGIDSPTVAACAAPTHRELSGRPLMALSTVYPHAPTVDERDHIASIVEQLGIPWKTYVAKYRRLEDVEGWVDRLDGPIFGPAVPALVELFRHTRETGARVVLSGELAELVYSLQHLLLGYLILRGSWRTAARHVRTMRRSGRSWKNVVSTIAWNLAPGWVGQAYVRARGIGEAHLPPWMDRRLMPGVNERWEFNQPIHRRWPELQRYFATGPTITGVEITSLCASHLGVRFRWPLADLDLWEFFLSLPAHDKFPGDAPKSLIRQVMRGRLPDSILDRRDKTTFEEDVRHRASYAELRRWTTESDFRLEGVDYTLLAERLADEDMTMYELSQASTLATIHAFVEIS